MRIVEYRTRRPRGFVMVGRLTLPQRLFLELFVFLKRSQRIRHLNDDLPLAMWAKALLAGVLVFDFELMPVRAHDVDSHALPTSQLRSTGFVASARAIGIWIQ